MRCVSASLVFLLAVALPVIVMGAEYRPVERPAIRTPVLPQTQSERKPAKPETSSGRSRRDAAKAAIAPQEKAEPEKPAKARKIPSFGRKKSEESAGEARKNEQKDTRIAGTSAGEKEKSALGEAAEKKGSAAASQSGAKSGGEKGQKLFGTVEFRRPLDTMPGWLDVLKRNSGESIFYGDKFLDKRTTWDTLRSRTKDLKGLAQLRAVNKFWNTWPYREDIVNWGKQDYWAIPAQFLLKSGDCEDFAIAKYFTLKELGVDPANMRIVVLRDTIRNLAHAVLAVYLDGDIYILDNISNIVLSHKRIGNYSPQFSINESGRWTHIKGKSAR